MVSRVLLSACTGEMEGPSGSKGSPVEEHLSSDVSSESETEGNTEAGKLCCPL